MTHSLYILDDSPWFEWIRLHSTDSTIDFLKHYRPVSPKDMILVTADFQTAGRGQAGNSWESEAGKNLLFGLLFHPREVEANRQFILSQAVALSICETLSDYAEDIRIKWPNDIIMSGKKVCGILTEMSAQFDYVNHIVVGIGINVQNKSFPKDIESVATSLFIETKEHYHRAELVERIWEAFEHYYEIFLQTEDLSGLVNEYNSHLVNMHQQVKVLDPKEPFEGKAMGITPKGELIVDTWESRKLVSTGEVSVRGIYGYV